MKITMKGAISMDDFERDLQQQLKNPSFKAEYDSLKPEYEIIQSIIDARKASHITQQKLAEITGINQADISKIENGNSNPTLNILKRIADGLGYEVHIEFRQKV